MRATCCFHWLALESSGRSACCPLSPTPVADPKDGLSVIVPRADPLELASALASPITALLPRNFSRLAPDATGAFVATPTRGALLLQRNLKAARGPAFVVTIEVRQARRSRRRAALVRGREIPTWDGSARAIIGRAREPLRFDAGVFGWAVLRTGRDAGKLGSAGSGPAPARRDSRRRGCRTSVCTASRRRAAVLPGADLPRSFWSSTTRRI